MPTSVIASNGTSYHLFQLRTRIKEHAETKSFQELENDLSDGYESSVLFGSDTGLRRWRLTLPTVPDFTNSATVTDINGALVTPLAYIRSLFDECKVTGSPFVVQSIENDQYYLVKFAQKEMTMERMLTKLYTTGLELKQVRVRGVTVFDFDGFADAWGAVNFDETNHATPDWTSANNSDYVLRKTGNVTFGTATLNGLNLVQLNVGATNDGFLDSRYQGAAGALQAGNVLLVLKVREATFSNNAGILSDTVNAISYLVGDDTTTKFQTGSPPLSYWLNGTEYAAADRQAPMNNFGVVRAELSDGDTFVSRIGQNLSVAGTFAEIDLAQMIFFGGSVPLNLMRECIEALTVKWATASN